MAEQTIRTLKQKIFELQQIYTVIQKEFEFIAMHSKSRDTGYKEASDCVKETAHSLEQFYDCLNQENPAMYQDFTNHPDTIEEMKTQLEAMTAAADELQKGNQVWIDSIMQTGTKQEQTNCNQIKEGE